MVVITKISVQKNNKNRYSIFSESGKGEEYAFSVDEDVLIKYQLKKGMELDDLPVSEILYQDDIRKAYNLALHYLAHRMRSEGEVREYLTKKEVAAPTIHEAINRLYKYKFLDDDEFAKAFVRTQMNTTDKGPEVVKIGLKEKGINEKLMDEAIREYPFEKQIEKAEQLANKLIIKNRKDSSRILKQKLEQFLIRKGYSFSVIQLVMEDSVTEKEVEEELTALRFQGEKLQRKHSKLTGFEYKQKIKQGLYNKGFSIELIDRYLEGLSGSEEDLLE